MSYESSPPVLSALSVMATAGEVTVSLAEVVMVKAEDCDPDDPNKTQVILQLQPIPTGEESAETDAAVMTVEAHEEQTDGDDVEIGCPITCGDCKALLLVKKFVCPGINVKCVKYEDQLISPKQFVHISGKATLKDWKRAIRMGGKMMDSGQLDFYEHNTLCTNTCRSTKFDLLINNTRFPPTAQAPPLRLVLGNGSTAGEDRAETLSAKMDWITSSLEAAEKKETSEISEDTLNFWKGIADVGLLGEVVTNISTELQELLNGVKQRREPAALQDTDSCLVEVAVLSNLAQVFGLLDSVKRIVETRRQQTDPSQEQVLCTLSNLEVQLEDQRKQQQVRALLSCPQPAAKTKTPPKRPPKRPRLQRPASTSATLLSSPITQQQTLQPQQFTVLSPISLTSMGQPFTMAGLSSSNTVTLLPAGSQLFTRYMLAGDGKTDTITLHPSSGLTLLGTALQDSGQLGTMVSPVELLQLTQQGGGEGMALEGQMRGLGSGRHDDADRHGGDAVPNAGGADWGVEGLQLDASGQLSGVQIVVIEDNTQEEHKDK
ncbi:hypothetical protein F7725_024802 [Dissostichus mawsoni]|uniref:SAND domain-containing protein n=1 Tax=Dissostichus mawsoni TaxID=36200 RepID=A0A7J5XB07_DISMA|nr:hypothetical protein F7725_024802 [Dissostichus mawsoni]